MKVRSNLIGFLIGLIISAPFVNAEIQLVSAGGISLGNPVTGGTANRILFTGPTGLLTDDPFLTTDTSAAGTNTFVFRRNSTAGTKALDINIPAGNTVSSQWGINLIATGNTSTGSVIGIQSQGSAAGAAAQSYGIIGSGAVGTTNKILIGVHGQTTCSNSCSITTNKNLAVWGRALSTSNTLLDIGVIGSSRDGSTHAVGVLALAGDNSTPWNLTPGLAALVADNQSTTHAIARFKDAGTDAVVIPDGGGLRLTGSGSKPACDATTAGMLWFTAGSPDTYEACTGTGGASYSWKTLI